MKTIILALASSLLLAPAVLAEGNDWDIDSRHSAANFTVKHMMLSNVQGSIRGINGKIQYDGKNVDTLSVKCSLDPSTINTGEPDRDNHLKGKDFFDVGKYPSMTFESTGVLPERPAAEGFKLGGKLTIHGVTKTVELTVDGPTAVFKDKKKGIEKIGAVATTKINRKDFGISYNQALDNGGAMVGDEVKITIDLEAQRKLPGAAPKK